MQKQFTVLHQAEANERSEKNETLGWISFLTLMTCCHRRTSILSTILATSLLLIKTGLNQYTDKE